jgi:hypothetical protein
VDEQFALEYCNLLYKLMKILARLVLLLADKFVFHARGHQLVYKFLKEHK